VVEGVESLGSIQVENPSVRKLRAPQDDNGSRGYGGNCVTESARFGKRPLQRQSNTRTPKGVSCRIFKTEVNSEGCYCFFSLSIS
jgi:hypothetical protein